MYQAYAQHVGWRFNILDVADAEHGGCRVRFFFRIQLEQKFPLQDKKLCQHHNHNKTIFYEFVFFF